MTDLKVSTIKRTTREEDIMLHLDTKQETQSAMHVLTDTGKSYYFAGAQLHTIDCWLKAINKTMPKIGGDRRVSDDTGSCDEEEEEESRVQTILLGARKTIWIQ
eukprot:CAMPEP_0168510852 /NCGR_PEP_ID=MMETSP0405-20121227/1737_1 /TAXON_ID=498012 /ORGANISM="Trichosphaerium sp, Strain Am-I-7 wt" /LENGTH=103 /DNA_ID=CAMNT_0008528819 /DNA_START=142 /DNA_END=453 /DNA_ORIENTATION=+